MNNKLYILTGLPYAGKTILRNELVKRFGFSVISIDEINTEQGVGIDKSLSITQKEWDFAYSESYTRLKVCLAQGKSVVFDGGSLLKKERETQRQIAVSLGVPTVLIYVKAPKEEIKSRWLENQESKVRGHVREDDFKAALKMWEEPTPDENPIIYSSEENLEEWIKQNL